MKKGTLILSAFMTMLAFVSMSFTTMSTGKGKVVWNQVVHLDAMQSGTESMAKGTVVLRLMSDMTLQYKINAKNLEANDMFTVAHIHSGGVGVNGPVVVDLTAGIMDMNRFQTKSLTMAQYNMLMNEETELYVNVHSSVYPAGVIRGQLQ